MPAVRGNDPAHRGCRSSDWKHRSIPHAADSVWILGPRCRSGCGAVHSLRRSAAAQVVDGRRAPGSALVIGSTNPRRFAHRTWAGAIHGPLGNTGTPRRRPAGANNPTRRDLTVETGTSSRFGRRPVTLATGSRLWALGLLACPEPRQSPEPKAESPEPISPAARSPGAPRAGHHPPPAGRAVTPCRACPRRCASSASRRPGTRGR